jgi:DNA-binding response OmpR family regulator
MAVTAFAAKGDEERIRDAGAEAYVSKPISVMKFIQSVNGLLDALRDEGPAPVVEDSDADEATAEDPDQDNDEIDPVDRHPRESGDSASATSPPEESQLDSHFRRNDEER